MFVYWLSSYASAECWTKLRTDDHTLLSLQRHHVRSILGLSQKDTWESRMTTGQIVELLGDPVDIADKIAMHLLEWLGHVGWRTQAVAGCIHGETRPVCGPRKRWRDCILSN